jgi:hypothetical protein
MWADVFTIADDVNLMFNNFLNTYLIIFNHSFPYKWHFSKQYNKTWITNVIRTSCSRKSELYVLSRNTDNPELVRYYKKYCRILSDIIIKSVTNAKSSKSIITLISSEGKSYNNPQTITNIFNNYFILPPNKMQLNKLTKYPIL